jgi:predicted ATPase
VHEHTDGNPFFVEEVLRHLIETGVLFERGGRWTSALTPDEIGVPDGVQEVLARRLARLSEPCRSALVAAAVLGRRCSFDIMRATVGMQDDELIVALEEARDAQLIAELDHGDEPAYAFTHALVRQTLYAGTSGPRRRRLHA